MEAADREPAGHGHRIEKSLLPLKKRASNYSSAGDPYASPSKKRRMADNSVVVAEAKNPTGALEAPVPRHRRTVPAAASREPAAKLQLPAPPAAPPPPEPAAEGHALAVSESDEEKKRLSKGKWLAKDDQSRSSPVTPHPPVAVKKLMHDGIRSFVPQQLRDEHRRQAASPVLSEALERRLAELDATRPWLVHSKALHKSDVDENQNRLLVSCKRGGSGTERCPITRCFSRDELARVHNKHAGLAVTALDRDGAPYALACKFLASNNGYRFITDWKHFLIRNGLNLGAQKHRDWKRDVEVELWAFRSRRLPFQPQLGADGKPVTVNTEGEDGKEVAVVQLISHHLDPDGSLGLLLLHHERVRSEEDQAGDDGDWKLKGPSSRPRPVACKKGKQQSGKRGASASPVAEQGGSPRHDAAFLVSFYAAVGLLRLRQSILERWREYVDRADGAKGLPNDVAKSPADDATSSADLEGEKVKKQKSLGTHSIKERGASSSQPIGNGGNKTSTDEDNGALEVPRFHHV